MTGVTVMDTIMIAIALYLLVGLVSLVVFDLFTRRIQRRITGAMLETQTKLAASGNLVGSKMALAVTLFAIWVFWPLVFYAALIKLVRR